MSALDSSASRTAWRWWQWALAALAAVVVLAALVRWWPRWLEKYRVRHERIRIQAEAQRRVWLESRGARYRPVPAEQVRRGWLLFGAVAGGGVLLLALLAWWWLRSVAAQGESARTPRSQPEAQEAPPPG